MLAVLSLLLLSTFSLRVEASLASSFSDLKHVFSPSHDLFHARDGSTLKTAVDHEEYNRAVRGEESSEAMHIGCSSYSKARSLRQSLESVVGSVAIHPVYFSRKNDKACYTYHANTAAASTLAEKGVTHVIVPHALKIDSNVAWTSDQLLEQNIPSRYTMEIGVGIGVLGKGLASDGSNSCPHDDVWKSIMSSFSGVQKDFSEHNRHIDHFFWTSSRHSLHSDHRDVTSFTTASERFKRALSLKCDFSEAEVKYLQSHISVSLDASGIEGDKSPDCMLSLASMASLHPKVSHISAHLSEQMLEIGELNSQVSDYVFDNTTLNSTDQNAYTQTGSNLTTPYSDIGLDGSNYVLGMIDTGVDDYSCFFVDDSGTQTTRTPGADYANPITEPDRRKVIQYVSWGDGLPSSNYDHGTWCAGASLGKCNFTGTKASLYDGLAHNAKIAVFDIDAQDNFLNVPDLYNIALPPAYSAGAKVSTNSWGTPGINTYTSKALDVDQYMIDNFDFLFVVAAGNDGRSGYTSVHSPGVSKNALTVGASDFDHTQLVYFSSIGYNYDQHMFKPNIVTPGTNLMSAGTRNTGETYTCNVQKSSGTSMATPIAAGAALLVRQYFENSSYWGSFCNSDYRSCPSVNQAPGGGLISGALVKAVLIHSGEALLRTTTSSSSVLPAVNLSGTPDRYQGWGQVQLSNVLPVPGVVDLGLYVADSEQLNSMTQRKYTVTVEEDMTPLRATIVWIDPVNVMWSSKNLLNDLDLIVISPSGEVFYGNNITADEFNPVERVYIKEAIAGDWTIVVVAHELAVGSSQDYSIVVTMKGTVQEDATNVDPQPAESMYINTNLEEMECKANGADYSLQRFQLEDWLTGESWVGVPFNIFDELNTTYPVYSCEFVQNDELDNSEDNRVYQCSACLPDGNYVASVDTSASRNSSGKYMRVSGMCNNVFLSRFQQEVGFQLTDGQCNACPSNYALFEVLMFANVTDDDSADYTWYGNAFYTISDATGRSLHMGTLLVSDEQADVYCLPKGTYQLALNDTELVSYRNKNAMVKFSYTTEDGNEVSVELTGTETVDSFEVDTDPSDDDDDPWYEVAGIVAACVAAVVIAIYGLCVWKQKRDAKRAKEEGLSDGLVGSENVA